VGTTTPASYSDAEQAIIRRTCWSAANEIDSLQAKQGDPRGRSHATEFATGTARGRIRSDRDRKRKGEKR
jgi:hypothetical protein